MTYSCIYVQIPPYHKIKHPFVLEYAYTGAYFNIGEVENAKFDQNRSNVDVLFE